MSFDFHEVQLPEEAARVVGTCGPKGGALAVADSSTRQPAVTVFREFDLDQDLDDGVEPEPFAVLRAHDEAENRPLKRRFSPIGGHETSLLDLSAVHRGQPAVAALAFTPLCAPRFLPLHAGDPQRRRTDGAVGSALLKLAPGTGADEKAFHVPTHTTR